MKLIRRLTFAGLVLVVFSVPTLLLAKEEESKKPRYSLPVGDKPGYVNTIEYQLMLDPKEAAALLLKEAAIAQVDIDRIGLQPPNPSIRLASGLITPDLSDDSFVRYASDMASQGFAEADTVCLIKISRGLSIREFAEIMGLGVQLYRHVPYAYIARVPFGVAVPLLEMPAVEWIGVFEPEHKISPHHYIEGQILYVYALIGDEQLCRADLATIGAEDLYFSHSVADGYAISRFSLRLHPDRLNELAAFWWVQVIGQESLYKDDSDRRAPSKAGRGTSILAQSFRPYDSRRLLSLRKTNNPYDGDGETLLVLDSGTWWDHPALKWRTLSEPVSNASRDADHGTFVSGIAVGEWNGSVSGGGIGGVAPRARLVSREHSQTTIKDALEMGLNVANFSFHSQTILDEPVLTYDEAASLVDDNSNDEHDVLVIVAAGTNTETVAAPAIAKNALAIGAINYVPADTTWDVIGRRSDYSSQGPTVGDQRLKPDLVAPGGSAFNPVVSCKAPCCNGSGLWYPFDGGYVFGWGTSGAAPHVSGAALIVQEWYRTWTRSHGLDGDPNYSRTSELMRAFLINTAIPLRANGDSDRPFPRLAGDNAATAETLKGFANTQYGFGLVNPYSGVLSPELDYWRALIWQDEVVGVLDTRERFFNVADDPNYQTGQPRYLVATMVYDDVPAAADDPEPLKDRLEFSLIDPALNEHKFALPFPLKTGTVQKIIIPNPSIEYAGTWKAKVFFAGSTDSRLDMRQRFAVVVDVMEKAPRLSLNVTEPAFVKTNTDFELPVTIRNDGGNVAVGVTVTIEDPDYCFFPGSADTGLFYVGNIVKGGDSITRTFKFRAPVVAKTCSLIVKVDTINKMMDGGSYPIRKKITLPVRDIRVVRGEVRMLPGFSQTVANAEILINGVPSGKRTLSNGTYEVEVEKNFAGTIRPKKGTTVFIPPSKNYSTEPVVNDRSDQDYEATYHTVSGIVKTEGGARLAGVTVTPRNAQGSSLRANGGVTDQNGVFTGYVEHGWTGKLEPQPIGQYATFNVAYSAHAFHDSIVANVTQHDFTTRAAFQWTIDGAEVSTTASSLSSPRVVTDGAGGSVTVWTDARNGSANHDIYAQRLGGDGSPLWGVQQLPVCSAQGIQDSPTISRMPDGTVVVAWRDQRGGSSDLYAQRVNANGSRAWTTDGVPVCVSSGDQSSPQATVLSDGSVLLVWEDRRGGSADVYAQRIAADGNAIWASNGVLVCSATGDQLFPRVESDGAGGGYVVWEDRRLGVTEVDKDVYAQRLSAAGSRVWSPLDGLLVSAGAMAGARPGLGRATDGACLVSFSSSGSMRAQKISLSGNLTWASTGTSAGLGGASAVSMIIPDNSAGAMVAWQTTVGVYCNGGIPRYPTIRVQRVGPNGGTLWDQDGMELAPGKSSDGPGIVADGVGGMFACWRQYDDFGCSSGDEPVSDIYVQRIDSTGCRYWSKSLRVCGADLRQQLPAIASDLVSGCFVAWHDGRSGTDYRIYGARVNDTPQIFQVAGRVRDSSGAGVPNILVEAYEGIERVATRPTDAGGNYTLSLPAFWRGDLSIKARGYLNTATPVTHTLGPMISSASGRDFTLVHTKTTWRPDGLPLDSSAPASNEILSLGAGGDLWLAWEGVDPAWATEPPVRVQHVTQEGDVQWTTDGDPIVAYSVNDSRPILVPAADSQFLFWRRSIPEDPSQSDVWAQKINEDMEPQWPTPGKQLASSQGVTVVSACADGSGGAFVCWNDEIQLFMQRVLADGSFAWTSPVYFGFGTLQCPPILQPDGSGGVLACWQQSGSFSFLNVQRLDPSGNALWGGPESWVSVTVRAYAHIPVGAFRLIGAAGGGAYVVWNERSAIDTDDDRIRVNWVDPGGNRHLGNAGVELMPTSSRQCVVADVARPVAPWHYGFLLLYVDREIGASISRLQIQQVLPGINQFLGRGWGDDGKTLAPNPAGEWNSRMLEDEESGGAIVMWCDYSGSLYAQCIDSTGARAWITSKYKISDGAKPDAPVNMIKDGSSGAYVTWHGTDGQFKAARVNIAVIPNAAVTISSFVRDVDGLATPMSELHANGCPKGDEDDMVFRLELRGDLMESPAASSITLSPPIDGGVKFFRVETADSTLRLNGDCYRTTITVSEFSGCGEDSAEVRINDWVVGYARYNARSPDINASGVATDAIDFAAFTAHYQSSLCNCIFPLSYSACVDFVQPDTMLTILDFAKYGGHYDHAFSGGSGVPSVVSNSGGGVSLRFEEVQQNGQRRLRVGVSLDGVQQFRTGFMVLRNENPRLSFCEWKQNPAYPQLTICAPTKRDGQNEIALGALGSKVPSMGLIELGTIDLLIDSDAPFELGSEDLEFVAGEILDYGGNVLGVAARGRDIGPRRYANWLAQNYPNPFNPTTTVMFSMAKAGHVDLVIYDVTGAVVKTLINESRKPNLHRIVWDGRNNGGAPVASGVYFYRLKAPGFVAAKKMLLLK